MCLGRALAIEDERVKESYYCFVLSRPSAKVLLVKNCCGYSNRSISICYLLFAICFNLLLSAAIIGISETTTIAQRFISFLPSFALLSVAANLTHVIA